MLVSVGRKQMGDGAGGRRDFPADDSPDEPADRRVGRFTGGPVPYSGPGESFVDRAQLGGRSGSVGPFEHEEPLQNRHFGDVHGARVPTDGMVRKDPSADKIKRRGEPPGGRILC